MNLQLFILFNQIFATDQLKSSAPKPLYDSFLEQRHKITTKLTISISYILYWFLPKYGEFTCEFMFRWDILAKVPIVKHGSGLKQWPPPYHHVQQTFITMTTTTTHHKCTNKISPLNTTNNDTNKLNGGAHSKQISFAMRAHSLYIVANKLFSLWSTARHNKKKKKRFYVAW